MELLEIVLKYLLLPATIISVIGYFGKQIVESYFTKRLEVYKTELNKVSYAYQIRFSKLHEKRVGIIEELYNHIIIVNRLLKSYNSNKAYGRNEEAELIELATKSNILNEFFIKNEIYFSDEVAKKILYLIKFINDFVLSYNLSHVQKIMIDNATENNDLTEKIKAEYEEDEKEHIKDDKYFINDYLPSLELKLKEEFRKLIGANE